MPVLPIVKYGNAVLTTRAKEINDITEEVVELAHNMVRTMHLAPGIGLAAPQVNVSKRLITVDISMGENKDDIIILINPKIVAEEGEIFTEESCLSIPGIQETICRPAKLIIRGIDLEGTEKTIEAQDLLAKVFSHEIDHLNGTLFIDHLSPLKKSLIKKKIKKTLNL